MARGPDRRGGHLPERPGRTPSHDVADFAWRVLLDREGLRAHYGEGFRTGLLTAPARGAAGQPEERAHGPAQQTSRTDYASFVRGRSDRTARSHRSAWPKLTSAWSRSRAAQHG